MKLIAGLGNPGKRYSGTRHNVGFDVIDGLSERFDAALKRSWRFNGRLGSARVGSEDALLLKPLTYMNLSGASIAAVLRYRKLDVRDLIVVVDDASIDFGRIRIRPKGSSGGHNGLQSIINEVGSEQFTRVRLGVGDTPNRRLKDHVLGRFGPSETAPAQDMIRQGIEAVVCIINSGCDAAMNTFNVAPDEGS